MEDRKQAVVSVSNKRPVLQPEPKSNISQLRPQPTEYVLAPGDNFYTVSKKLGVSFNELAKYNNIPDVLRCYYGDNYMIPDHECSNDCSVCKKIK